MLKSIFIQLWNRKKSNIWLFFELLFVFCITWYIVDYFFVLNYNRSIPNPIDIEHTWQVNISEYISSSSDYKEENNNPELRETNFLRILQMIENYPEVEALGVSFYSSTPGSGGMNVTTYRHLEDSTKIIGGQEAYFDPRWDFFKVFRYTKDNGTKLVSVKDYDWNSNSILIGEIGAKALYPDESIVGKKIRHGYNESHEVIVMDVLDDTKRFDYLRPRNVFYNSRRIQESDIASDFGLEVSIRAKSSISDKIFKEKFINEMTAPLQIGNFYLKNITSYKTLDAKIESIFGVTKDIKIRTYLMIFFLLNIVLCLIGTFWYRINTRREEIGLRKALGSSQIGIRNNMLLEGLCLLTIVLLPAMIIEYQFVRAGMIDTLGWSSDGIYLPDKTILRFLITNGITWLVMAIVTVLAIWIPATKAAKLEAADALRDE